MSVARNDLGLYERHAHQWWDGDSRFSASLASINRHRLGHIAARFGSDLAGLAVADLGCGGGLMSEPLARAGALVVGVDLGQRTVRAARAHGAGLPGLGYVCGDARRPPLAGGWADLVLCADVVEHVEHWPRVLAAAAMLLRPDGWCYVNTINRTQRARWLAVHAAEGLGLIPPGTHDPRLLVRPGELQAAAEACGLRLVELLGQRLHLWRTLRDWRLQVGDGPSLALGYGAWLRRASGRSGRQRVG